MRIEQWFFQIPLLFRSLFRRREVEQELDDEIQYHIEQQIEVNLAAGMNDEEARIQARRSFGYVPARRAMGTSVLQVLRYE